MNDEINDVYLTLDSIFKLKLKSQIKESGLTFKKFLYITDLVKENKYYMLYVCSDVIYFNDLGELYSELERIIDKELIDIMNEVNSYQNHLRTDLKCDETFIHNELDGLGYKESKLYKIKAQIEKNTKNKK